jgi:hypothetical protein
MIPSQWLIAKFPFRNQQIFGARSLENVTQASNIDLSPCPSNADFHGPMFLGRRRQVRWVKSK